MGKLIAFGLAVGAGVQAFRVFPPDAPYSASSAVVVMVVAVLLAYLGGRSRRPSAVAVASATAVATAENRVQVNLFTASPGAERASDAAGVRVPSESTSWRSELVSPDPSTVFELLSDGADLSELGLEPYEDRA